MINRELMQKWVAALRSGYYKQGKGKLRPYEDKYCCLGVLCNLIDPNHWNEIDRQYVYKDFQSMLPSEDRNNIGIDYGTMALLIKKNDQGETFQEIADYLQRTFLNEC